jgi:hypothetical protein
MPPARGIKTLRQRISWVQRHFGPGWTERNMPSDARLGGWTNAPGRSSERRAIE